MRPLDRVRSIKVKFGGVILVAVAMTLLVNEIGLALDIAATARWLLAAALSLALVQLLAHGMTSPLREMAAATEAMAGGDYSTRVHATSRDEVGELARAFTRMAADLSEVDAQRRRLVADVSHELRTPIAALQALLENLADGVATPDPQTFETALAQTKRLGRLVTQLLDLSRLESGVVPLERRRTPLAPLLDQAVREAEVADRDVTVTARVDPQLTAYVDAERIHQVLANLLDNATRHSPPGSAVELSAGRTPSGVALAVTDAGPGIPAADRERVFERFARVDDARSGGAGGTGLGLAIARWVVDLHGGTIRVESAEPGPGCRVVVELPGVPPD
jgi:signal transduction histidine kinase